MNSSLKHDAGANSDQRTALVLGGGGAAGNAWLIGVVAGLLDRGLDVTDADLIVGTSAGATAAAQITAVRPGLLLGDILAAPISSASAPNGSERTTKAMRLTTDHLTTMRATIAASADAADWRRRMGELLRATAANDKALQTRWRSTVAARIPSADWTPRRMLLTAVDAVSGESVVFDRRSGVDLVDAVAASCAGGFAYDISGGSYIDGGYRANADNADLATGYGRVLVLSPLGGMSWTPKEWGTHLATQLEALSAGGSVVETVFPDDRSREAFGDNLMDLSTRPPAARAGHSQGAGRAEELMKFWS